MFRFSRTYEKNSPDFAERQGWLFDFVEKLASAAAMEIGKHLRKTVATTIKALAFGGLRIPSRKPHQLVIELDSLAQIPLLTPQ